jgi:TP901 family phage tail tape measure protein
MAIAAERLEVQVSSDGAQETAERLQGIGAAATSAKKAVGAMGAALAAASAGGIAKSIKAFGSFDSAMQESISIMSDVSDAQREKLEDTAREVAKSTTKSHEAAAQSFYYLASAGFDAAQSIEAMPEVAALAEAGAMDMAQATDYASDILSAFNKPVSELTTVTDTLTGTVKNHNSTMEGMGSAMSYVAPVAEGLGVSIQETSAAIGLLSDAGIKGSKAGTTLRQALNKLANPTNAAQEKLNQLGVSVTDSEGKMRDFTEVVNDLQAAGASAADIMELFGARAGPGMQVLLSKGGDAIQKEADQLKEMQGVTQEVAKTQKQTLNKQIDLFQSKITDLGITIGEWFAPKVIALLKPLNSMADRLLKIQEESDGAKGAIALLTTTVTGAAGALSYFGVSIGSVLGPLGVLSGAVLVYKDNIAGARDATQEIAATLKSELMATVETANAVIPPILTDIASAFGLTRSNAEDATAGIVSAVQGTFVPGIKTAGQAIRDALKSLDAAWQSHGQATITTVKDTYATIKAATDSALSTLTTLTKTSLSILLNAYHGAWADAEQSAHSLFDTLTAAFTSGLETLHSVAESGLLSLRSTWAKILLTLPAPVSSVLMDVQLAIADGIDTVRSTVKTGLAAVTGYWDSHGTEVANTVTGLFSSIVNYVTERAKTYKAIITGALDGVLAAWGKHGDALLAELGETLTLLANTVSGMLDTVAGAWKKHRDEVTQITAVVSEAITSGLLVALTDLLKMAQTVITGADALWQAHGGTVTAVLESITTKIEPLVSKLGGVKEASAAVAITLGALISKFSGVALGVSSLLGPLGTAGSAILSLGGYASGLVSSLGSIVTTLGGLISSLSLAGSSLGAYGSVLTGLTGPIGILVAAIGGLALAATTDMQEIETTAKSMASEMEGFVLSEWQLLHDAGISIFDSLQSSVAVTMASLKTQVTNPAQNMNTEFGQNIQEMKDEAGQTFSLILDVTKKYTGLLASFVSSTISDMAAVWSANMTGDEGILANTVTAFNAIWSNVIKPTLDIIQAAWNEWGDELLTILKAALDAIRTTLTIAFDAILTLVNVTLNLISGDWEGAWTNIETFTKKTFNRLGNFWDKWFGGYIDSIGAWLDSLYQDIVSWGDDILSDIKETFGQIGTYVLETATPDLVGAFESLGDGIIGALESAAKQAVEAFNNIMPDELTIPEFTVGGGSGISWDPVKAGGETIIEGGSWSPPSATLGGDTIEIPNLPLPGGGSATSGGAGSFKSAYTGGMIESGGLARLHAGERVVPSAEVDRTPGQGGSMGSGSVHIRKIEVNNPESGEDVVDEMIATLDSKNRYN